MKNYSLLFLAFSTAIATGIAITNNAGVAQPSYIDNHSISQKRIAQRGEEGRWQMAEGSYVCNMVGASTHHASPLNGGNPRTRLAHQLLAAKSEIMVEDLSTLSFGKSSFSEQ